MPSFKQIASAREKSRRIREHGVAFQNESARIAESIKQTQKLPIPLAVHKSTPNTERVRLVGRVA